ncbi:MAG TPA: aldose epimerase family protein [Ignavibacteriaceae bacterium]|nr:aldose epimerase family protein [Ignavibacteriaceae bacterium]
MHLKKIFIVLIIPFLFVSIKCSDKEQNNRNNKKLFGKLENGEEVYMYTLKNKNGMKAEITNYGATVVSLLAPDKNGKMEDVILGYDSLKSYENGTSYFGAIVGRYGNRIGKGRFSLEGKEYQLTINNGENHLHGGTVGFNKLLWKTDTFDDNSVKMTLVSPNGDQGYPGKITLTVTYTLTDNNELRIEYSGTTDKPTILNPTNHCYFNLTGNPENTILNHELKINAEKFTPVDEGLITTGELADVNGTPMDFRTPVPIGKNINNDFQQLIFGKGYDHNWVINNYNGNVREAAIVYDPSSGRVLEVLTDQPGIQFYSGNFLDGSEIGKGGIHYQHRTGFCLEAQHYPDSPNKNNFPTVELKPGKIYTQSTIYRFTTK